MKRLATFLPDQIMKSNERSKSLKFGLYLISDGASRHFFSKKKYSYYAWRVLIKVADKFPKILKIGMRSKTWEDHLLISRNKDNFNL